MARGFGYAPGASPEVDDARAPGLHRATLAMHAQSKNALVREVVAAREDLPFGLMVTLAHDRSVEVRRAVASNPTAVAAVLDHLAGDRDPSVVTAVVTNPSLPAPVLERLVFHKNAAVRRSAAHRLDTGGLESVPPMEDSATPELRDVAVGARFHGGPVELAPAIGDATPAARPTRTAPIRGFRIPEQ